jgi:hypothetical protein
VDGQQAFSGENVVYDPAFIDARKTRNPDADDDYQEA